MAKKPTLPAAKKAPSANETWVEDANRRLADCRRQKYFVLSDLREGYFLTRPRLARQIVSTLQPIPRPPQDEDELCTSVGSEVVEDFATEVINAFMPPNVPWANTQPGEGVSDQMWETVKDVAQANDDATFKAIRASNFDSELAMSLVPEAALGTHAMWIDDHWAHAPLLCQHIPLRELEINVGPFGGVGDRNVVRWVRWRNVPALFPGVALPAGVSTMITDKPEEWAECKWCYWRDWSVQTDVAWREVVMVDAHLISTEEYRGEGSCPLIVGRFSPDSLHAFGNGPTIESLPYLRILNVLAEVTQDHAPYNIRPPIAYPDDGVMNFDNGIRDGMAYPKRPGSKGEIESLVFEGNAQLGFFTTDQLEKVVRRKHFADYPDQPGKTPPSATQWLDEMQKSQRRIGTPGQTYWREFPCEVFLRFRYLLEKRGILQKIANQGKQISTRPQNPATKAQDTQEMQISTQLLGIIKQFFPQTSQAAIDELQTIMNFKEKAGDKIIVLRDKATVQKLIQGMLQGAGAAAGGGAGAGAQAGAAPAVPGAASGAGGQPPAANAA